MSVVLYRKYRPISFDEIVGQEYIVKILKNSLAFDKTAHAYIFTGPRGSGKTSMAKIFADYLNCENLSDAGVCGKCSFCINSGEKPDVIEIDAASNNGVNEVRELKNNCELLPTFGKYKVYIVDEVHMLSTSAFNALLKILEEPPKHIVFILATTEINKVPLTIISRTQRFDFEKIDKEKIVNRMNKIAKKENLKIDQKIIELIADYADGSMRDALTIMNQVSVMNALTMEDFQQMTGIALPYLVDEMFEILEERNIEKIPKLLAEIKKNNTDILFFVKRVMFKYENLMLNCADDYVGLKKNIEKIKLLNEIYNSVANTKIPLVMFECLVMEYLLASKKKETLEQPEKTAVVEKEKNIDDVIINNALCYANKKEKQALVELFKNSGSLFIKMKLGLLNEVEIVIVGKNYVIFVGKDALIAQINKKKKQIKKIIDKITNQENNLLFVNKEKIEIIKTYYRDNKNKLKYISHESGEISIQHDFADIIEEED